MTTHQQKILDTHAELLAVQKREQEFEKVLDWAAPKTYSDEIHAMRRSFIAEKDRVQARALELMQGRDPDQAEGRCARSRYR